MSAAAASQAQGPFHHSSCARWKLSLSGFSRISVSLLTAAAVVLPGAAGAQSIQLVPVLTGLSSPVYVTSAHDGTQRLFIVEQTGTIRVRQPGSSTSTLFLSITTKVKYGGEQGLLGLAFHPGFPGVNRFFVHYNRKNDGAGVIAEYSVSADPDVANTAEKIILVIAQPFSNHNGGMIEFGPDGFLYIAKGDGGSSNDPNNRAQSVTELLGKILRINVDAPNVAYASPSTNPYFGATAGRDEIYALGFRNPWRFSFDRLTGELWVGDVGQGAWEEVDNVTLGGNYGWRRREGAHCTPFWGSPCTDPAFTDPVVDYATHVSGHCAVTGGYAYRGTFGTFPPGTYVFGDYCTGEIFKIQNGTMPLLLDTSAFISSFGEDEAGEIYAVDLGGTLYRITSTAPPDLKVSALGAPPTGPTNGSLAASDTTANLTGGANQSITRFYLSVDKKLDASDRVMGERPVPPLGAGDTSAQPSTITVPSNTQPGTYYVIAKADGPGTVSEQSETNNTRTRAIRLGPDLTLIFSMSAATVQAGASVMLKDTTSNKGGNAAGTSTTRFYLSSNDTFGTGDQPLGSRTVPSLAAGAKNSGSISSVIPPSTAPGTYFVLAIADGNAVVAEGSETNNLRKKAITVQ